MGVSGHCTEPPFALGDLPWSFWFSFVSSWRSVSLDVRHERAAPGLLNRRQRRERRLDQASVSSVTSCWIYSPLRFAPLTRISFRVFSVFHGYILIAEPRPGVTESSSASAGDSCLSLTSPNQPAAANPAIASGLQAGRHWRGVADPERSAPSARG